MFTLESVKKMHQQGLLKYEFSILGVPSNKEELETWLKNFQKLRNELSNNNAVTFESIAFCNSL